jgi:hypothetical protein
VARCERGVPSVIAVAPALDDGTLFPTLFWLTCPSLVEAVSRLESAGEHREWASRAAADPGFAGDLLSADAAYRAARKAEGGGTDPCPDVGVAGQADPLAVKCLHARVASALAGTRDPVGEGVLRRLAAGATGPVCDPSRCEPAVTAS